MAWQSQSQHSNSHISEEKSYDHLVRGLTLQRFIDERLLPAIARGFIEEVENCVFGLDLALHDEKDAKFNEKFWAMHQQFMDACSKVRDDPSQKNGERVLKMYRRDFARVWAQELWLLMNRKGILGGSSVREIIK